MIDDQSQGLIDRNISNDRQENIFVKNQKKTKLFTNKSKIVCKMICEQKKNNIEKKHMFD